MATDVQAQILKNYARRVREALRAHPENTEPGLAPEFHRLLVELLPTLPAAQPLTVVAEFENAGVGRPDIALKRAGQPARAFVELKAKGKTTDGSRWRDAHDKRQFKRFSELAHWAVCNFHEFRYYEREEKNRSRTRLSFRKARSTRTGTTAAPTSWSIGTIRTPRCG